MIDLTIATVQYRPVKNNVRKNLDELISLSSYAVKNGAGLIHLPEMCTTGYIYSNFKDAKKISEKKDGKSFSVFSRFCAEKKCHLAYGYLENDGGSLFNSMNLVGPDGELLLHYRKVHLYDADTKWATSGDKGFMHCDTWYGRIGLGICMDLNFDDFIEYHIDCGADVILISTCWLEENLPVHKYWLYRIYPFSGAVSLANCYGNDSGVEFCGRSAIINRLKVMKSAPATGNAVILHKVI